MKTGTCIAMALLAVVGWTAAPVSAAGGALEFELGEDSAYLFGCFPTGMHPCLCAIHIAPDFEGSMTMRRVISQDPDVQIYTVEDVAWVAGFGDGEILVTGFGAYQISEADGESFHRLTLALEVGDAPKTLYDSGLVPGGDAFPAALGIEISIPDAQCFTTVMDLSANRIARIRRHARFDTIAQSDSPPAVLEDGDAP